MPKELPANPSLENLKKQAKALLKSHQQGLTEANERFQSVHPEWSRKSIKQIKNAEISLSDAQWVIAREYGFDSWVKLSHSIKSGGYPVILIVYLGTRHSEGLSKFLKRRGYGIVVASDRVGALKIAKGNKPDLVLLDVWNEGIKDSFEICRQLKANRATADIPVIFATAGESYAVEAFRSGASDFFTRPFSLDELLTRIRIHLGIQE